jgi:hypothetical protein
MRRRQKTRYALAVAAMLAPAGACRREPATMPIASAIGSSALAVPDGTQSSAPAGAGQRAAQTAEEPYPNDITPPPGTSYPCALTALPRSLSGIPEGERAYINRTYTRLLRATQAKLVVLKALEEQADRDAAFKIYDKKISRLTEAIRDDTAPEGLQSFQADLVAALDLQRTFFREGTRLRQTGHSMEEVFNLPQGREASSRLMGAWQTMEGRYPAWDEATKDSIYHHLCALDLF